MSRGYDPTELIALLEGLLTEHNESWREASLRAGLDHGAIGRYIRDQRRPSRGSLLVLADHFRVNPNTLLTRAGYDPMEMFERESIDPDRYSPQVRRLADDLQRIGDPVLRRRLAESLRFLIEAHLPEKETNRT